MESEYTAIKVEVIIPYLKKGLEDWREENEIIDFDKEFTIDGISLSRITDNSVHWSITLYSDKISHYVTIDFVNFAPKGLLVDG